MHTRYGLRRGFTLVEVVFASAMLLVMILAIVALTQRNTRVVRSTIGIAAAETRAQRMLCAIERELSDACGANPITALTAAAGAGETGALVVGSTAGFPDHGFLLVDRGAAGVERIQYGGLEAGGTRFVNLVRGHQCTTASNHAPGAEILWGGLAEPILIQTSPAAALWDGRAREPKGPLFFRGDGSGFSFREPVDPAGGHDVLDENGAPRWGATVESTPTANGWSALYFEPTTQCDEAYSDDDINGDGDRTDVFDVGQIRRRSWDTSDPTREVKDIALGPTVVLQERCNWGADLDGDGFEDPLFLWDEAARRLHIRLFIIGTGAPEEPVVRRVESVVFLRNDPQQ